MVKKKMVIKVSMPSEKSRAKAMAMAARVSGVSSVSVTGESKDQLEVVGEDVDAVCLVSCLRGKKEFGHVVILLVEDVKDKKKEEEEKKKKAEEEKKKKEAEEKKKKEAEKPPQCSCPAGYPCYCHPRLPPPPPPYFVCEEPATSCSIM
ncbi:hypothetical protein EJB05_39181 [Eragrostis curvula]|uniref:HMA domain-containing protein n=1 Tax=Eragrostis curvula TaxID=38414 RepID=A0A5J9TW91_9POAL|nr:hypothetical protein EJB05_39181 [Eragrostis curvula]